MAQPSQPSSEEEESNLYDIEEVIDVKIKGGQTVYKVKWLNYPLSEATWEPLENFVGEASIKCVQRYLDKNKSEKRKRRVTNDNFVVDTDDEEEPRRRKKKKKTVRPDKSVVHQSTLADNHGYNTRRVSKTRRVYISSDSDDEVSPPEVHLSEDDLDKDDGKPIVEVAVVEAPREKTPEPIPKKETSVIAMQSALPIKKKKNKVAKVAQSKPTPCDFLDNLIASMPIRERSTTPPVPVPARLSRSSPNLKKSKFSHLSPPPIRLSSSTTTRRSVTFVVEPQVRFISPNPIKKRQHNYDAAKCRFQKNTNVDNEIDASANEPPVAVEKQFLPPPPTESTLRDVPKRQHTATVPQLFPPKATTSDSNTDNESSKDKSHPPTFDKFLIKSLKDVNSQHDEQKEASKNAVDRHEPPARFSQSAPPNMKNGLSFNKFKEWTLEVNTNRLSCIRRVDASFFTTPIDAMGNTLLHKLATSKKADAINILRMFVKMFKAPMTVKNMVEDNLLHAAFRANETPINGVFNNLMISELCSLGCNVNSVNHYCEYPLFLAYKQGNIAAAYILLVHGANPALIEPYIKNLSTQNSPFVVNQKILKEFFLLDKRQLGFTFSIYSAHIVPTSLYVQELIPSHHYRFNIGVHKDDISQCGNSIYMFDFGILTHSDNDSIAMSRPPSSIVETVTINDIPLALKSKSACRLAFDATNAIRMYANTSRFLVNITLSKALPTGKHMISALIRYRQS